MVVYIEYFLIINMGINMLVLYLALTTLRERISVKRLFLSALIGTAAAFLLPFVKYFTVAYKASAALLMTAVFKNKSIGAYVWRAAVFAGYSFFLGGVIGGLFNLQSGAIAGASVYGGSAGAVIPFVLGGGAVFFLLVRRLFISARERRRKRFYYRTKLVIGGFCEELTGYYDSGNKLYDTSDNTPAAIISADVAERIIAAQNPSAYTLEINTVGGRCSLKAFKVDKLWIYFGENANIIENMTVAVADKEFKNFKILLHSEMTGEERF
ncbi:MAG: sigma-E processing peptidase SpoIIGA [Clostridiales bacterium]|jgi:sigma-E processing peptidase SpoIIGA|nr:sigma-E processing peptidase SpoIIGA [Clostridiales bacterium]